jgi:hypothetical protein
VVLSNTVPVGGHKRGKIRVGEPDVLHPENGASGGLCRSLKTEGDVIRSGTRGGGESSVWQREAPIRINENPI